MRPPSCIWVQVVDPALLDRWPDLIGEIDAATPRAPVLVFCPRDALDRVRRRLPGHRVIASPPDSWRAVRRAFISVGPRAVVMIGDPATAPDLLVRRAQSWDMIPVAVEDAGGDLVVTPFAAATEMPPPAAVADARDAAAAVRAALVWHHHLRRRGENAVNRSLRNRLLRLPPVRAVAAYRSRRIASLPELKDRLGHPDTIACVGSGPSSEDPALRRLRFDRLFRVNLQWADRGFLDDPDLIVSWNPRIMRVRPRAIAAVSNELRARQFLARSVARRVFGPVGRYVVLDDLPPLPGDRPGNFSPTNGALMIQIAAALRPKRLIVAGFDLYNHPGGIYPGDGKTQNDYAFVHSRDSEIAYIAEILDGFDGEVVIVGDILRDALAARNALPEPVGPVENSCPAKP